MHSYWLQSCEFNKGLDDFDQVFPLCDEKTQSLAVS